MASHTGKEPPLVYIATAPNEVVANFWKGILDDNGIKNMLKSVNLVASLYVSLSMTQYEIYVLPEEADKAREILKPFIEAEENQENNPSSEGSETENEDQNQ